MTISRSWWCYPIWQQIKILAYLYRKIVLAHYVPFHATTGGISRNIYQTQKNINRTQYWLNASGNITSIQRIISRACICLHNLYSHKTFSPSLKTIRLPHWAISISTVHFILLLFFYFLHFLCKFVFSTNNWTAHH